MTRVSGDHTKILLLDVMGTLVFDPFYERVPSFFEIPFEQLLRQKHPTAWLDFELGKIDEAQFLPNFFSDGRDYDHEGLKRTMEHSYEWLPGMEALVAELANSSIPMHALSNYTPWYSLIEGRTGLSRFVRWSFVSCDTGVRKPDPEAYLGAARTLGVDPPECLFVDDRDHNCEAAEAVGMPAILFTDAKKLRDDLRHRGLIV